jgi:hypothetical protein
MMTRIEAQLAYRLRPAPQTKLDDMHIEKFGGKTALVMTTQK